MPRILDNVDFSLLDALLEVFRNAYRADFCVGYLHLRGWNRLADAVDSLLGSAGPRCRVLVGMQRPPEEQTRLLQSAIQEEESTLLDGPTLARLKREAVEGFRRQIEFGVPTAEAEVTLRRLAQQIRAGMVQIKLFLRYTLHAKLYVVHRSDPVTPLIAFVGSSNLTLPGLSEQGELNVDVVDQDAAQKLHRWFEERWNDRLAIDISEDLAELIESSWARKELVPPYLVHLKMAYHLSEDAIIGARQFKLPKDFDGVLLDFQAAAVQLAARMLYKHGGVLIGDVVGLGKTLVATAVAKIFQEDDGSNTLIICPPNLMEMWQWHTDTYRLSARVLSIGSVIDDLPNLPRFRTLIIDESQNLRNREGKRYRAIRDYIDWNEPRVILVTATPYNKQFTDLSNQLRLFLDEGQDLGIRPERFFREWYQKGYTEADFSARFQSSPGSLRAFEQSPFPDDWRDLMRLFLVRRTRQFIVQNYAQYDPKRGRYYVMLNGKPSYFPVRRPNTVSFSLDESDPNDQYARLFQDEVVQSIEELALPRYGLANYLIPNAEGMADERERKILNNLNRAGRRLIGFCRTNLYKRSESSGASFLLSLQRHVLRNMVTLYALENDLPVPIGTQDAAMLDTAISDEDEEWTDEWANVENRQQDDLVVLDLVSLDDYHMRAEQVYQQYQTKFLPRFQWLTPIFFTDDLREALLRDARNLLGILQRAGRWDPDRDTKLKGLYRLLTETYANDKVLVFTQFADTANYLYEQLQSLGVKNMAVATSGAENPVSLARRFSPRSNGGLRPGETELRILIATDVLSEGQNLQDCHIVVNYDLPWAIIRLIQRAGRVDRIGQEHDVIHVYSFWPPDGVDRIIRLRARLFRRLQENQEVIGTDESFFGEQTKTKLLDLYVDPEMIGKVYESLVNISSEGLTEEDMRGSAGIFYTPRVEIDLMCRLALVDHLTNHLGMEQRHLLYQSVFAYDPKEKEEADFAIANENLWPELDRLLREVTVCDPACGSGSFLVGMLLVLDDLQERANRQLGREETPYERRRRIIGEQLYGVDVMDWAVHVAELRLWLQLTVETEIKKAEAHLRPLLPNFSFKVRPGDSLVQEIGGVNFGLHRQRLVPAKAGMDIPSPLKGKLTQLKGKKLRFYQGDPQLSEVELKQEEVRLFQDILRHRQDTLQRDIKLLTSRIESPEEQLSLIEVERKEPKQLTMAVERWKQERQEKQIELERVQDALRALRSAKDTPFVWDIAFVEIFEGDKKGFDIVIGNPPYVRQEKIAPPGLMESDYEPWEWNRLKSDYKAKLQRSVASAWPRFFQSPPLRKQGRRLDARSDLYIYFYLHALSLLNEKGSFCFITSNSWLDVGYGKDLQEFLLKHSHVKMVIDNQVKRSFAQSDVNTVIVLLASPMDRPHSDKQMQERLARFVMFKTHFEDVLHPAIFLELEDAGDRLVHPEFRVVVKDQHSLYEEGLEELEGGPLPSQGHALADTRRYEGGKWGGKYLRAPDIFFTILEKAKRYRAFAFGDEKIIVEDITDNIED